MIPAAVEYVRPESLEEAIEALTAADARVLAGGQSLVPAMKLRIARPSVVVDISSLDLAGISRREGALAIGALTTWDDLEHSETLRRPAYLALPECAAGIGDMQVRNRGTVGGSLAHADPAADFPAVALALGATLTLHGPTGERALPAAELAVGPFATVLDEGELITEIVVAEPPPGTGSAYVSVEHPASGFALAGAGALVGPDGNSRVALTGLGIAPFVMDGDLRDAEIFGDRFAPEEYRRQLARTVAARALERAETRAKEDMRWTA